MARRQDLKRPREYVQDGAEWPEGPLVADAPPEARLAQGIALKIKNYSEGKGPHGNPLPPYKIAQRVDIAPQTLYNLLDGETWGGFVTIARLEIFFDRRLWGNEHRKRR